MMDGCYTCKFHGTVPGSAHSSCKVLDGSPGSELLKIGILAGRYEINVTVDGVEQKAVEFDEHGIKKGWANWPYDFDPVWLKKCVFKTEHLYECPICDGTKIEKGETCTGCKGTGVVDSEFTK